MKLPLKIALISLAIDVVLSVVLLVVADPKATGTNYLLAIGIGSLLGGLISVVLAIIFFVAKSKEWGKGFLLTTGLLFLLGFATCSGGIMLAK
jgi:peptidoglycan biosynthesis protein MviN/MurJ (putative lipid II flippase)